MTLDKLINGLERFRDKLEDKQVELLKQLGEYGVEYAKNQVLNVDTGETRDSIHYDIKDKNTLIIEAGGNAIWLEFGTGIVKNELAGVSYLGEKPDGIVEHGQYGKGQGANPNGWLFPTKDGGVKRTQGIQANMFMYKTSLELAKKAPELGLKLISAELKI